MALSYAKAEKSGGFQKAEPELVSLELDDEDQMDMAIPMPSGKSLQPQYPWGLRISLTETELAKLGLDHSDAKVGDYLEFRARACVTSTSESKKEDGGSMCRVELQIESMCVCGGDEDGG